MLRLHIWQEFGRSQQQTSEPNCRSELALLIRRDESSFRNQLVSNLHRIEKSSGNPNPDQRLLTWKVRECLRFPGEHARHDKFFSILL